jgi:hypothetical protein
MVVVGRGCAMLMVVRIFRRWSCASNVGGGAEFFADSAGWSAKQIYLHSRAKTRLAGVYGVYGVVGNVSRRGQSMGGTRRDVVGASGRLSALFAG